MNSLSFSRYHLESTLFPEISINSLFFPEITMNTLFFAKSIWIHFLIREFTIHYSNIPWIYYLFREFTIDQLFFRTLYEFTIFFAKSLWKHHFFANRLWIQFFTWICSDKKHEITYSDSEKDRLGRSKDVFISLFLTKFNSTVKSGQLW